MPRKILPATKRSLSAPEPSSPESALPGQRQTRQREVIFKVLKAARGPLTIPEILIRSNLDKKSGKTGIATIYRTINLLLANGLIRQVILPTGETRYEVAEAKGHHHHHFKCNKCEGVFDLDLCPVGLPQGTMIPGGFRIDSHEVTLFGLCGDCLRGKTSK
jgi:Fur family transcriptional regulator, ferric uptake regulator